MAYEEPGIKVIQQLSQAAANIAAATQAATLVGELYEVFSDRVLTRRYDALTGAGSQAFTWPGKKTTSVVDLAGVRKDTAEPDSQLDEYAVFPLAFKLRDPITSQIFSIDKISGVFGVSQTGFSLAEKVDAAGARLSGAVGTGAQANRLHSRLGGAVNAGVSVGDRVRVTNAPTLPIFDIRGKVTAFADDDVTFQGDGTQFKVNASTAAGSATFVATVTDKAVTLPATGVIRVDSGGKTEDLAYGSVSVAGLVHTFTLAGATLTRLQHDAQVDVKLLVRNTVNMALTDGNIVASSGHVASAAGGLTGRLNQRIAIWPENLWVNTGSVAGGGFRVNTSDLTLTEAHVGRLATVWTDTSGVTFATGASVGGVSVLEFEDTTNSPFLAAHVGLVIKIGSEYRRVTSVVSASKITYSGAKITNAAGITFFLYVTPVVCTITAVDVAGGGSDFFVDTAVSAVAGALPVVIHRPEYRDVTSVVTDFDVVYSGSAIVPDTTFGRFTPVSLFTESMTFEVMPDFELLTSFRALDIAAVNDTLAVSTISEVQSLGAVHKANPLLWAANSALLAMGTTDVPVLLQSVDLFSDALSGSKSGFPEDRQEALGYGLALEILSSQDSPYFLVPLTRDESVRSAFRGHVLAQSQPTAKHERVVYQTYDLPLGDVESVEGLIAPGFNGGNKRITDIGAGFISTHGLIPGNAVVIQKPAAFAGSYVIAAGSDDDNLVLEGTPWQQDGAGSFLSAAKEFSVANADTTVTNVVDSATSGVWKDVQPGDYLLLGSQTRLITAVSNFAPGTNNRLAYSGSALTPAAASQSVSILRTSVGVEFYAKPMDKTEQAAAIAAISQGLGSRRYVNFWPDSVEQITGTDTQGNEVKELVPSFYAAAAEAGRDSVIPSARSSTGMSLAGFTGLDHSNRYFSTAQLNVIAGGGWSILEQKVVGGPVTMRHLLTTDMSTVKSQELSFTKNVDNMAKVKRASTEPLLNDDSGRVNITQDLLTSLAFPFQGIYESFVRTGQLVRTSGKPAYKILSIRQDPLNADCILEDVELNVPLPANRVVVTFVI
jgi:hypothetical protein